MPFLAPMGLEGPGRGVAARPREQRGHPGRQEGRRQSEPVREDLDHIVQPPGDRHEEREIPEPSRRHSSSGRDCGREPQHQGVERGEDQGGGDDHADGEARGAPVRDADPEHGRRAPPAALRAPAPAAGELPGVPRAVLRAAPAAAVQRQDGEQGRGGPQRGGAQLPPDVHDHGEEAEEGCPLPAAGEAAPEDTHRGVGR
mmetsp:Transcript_1534/g.4504  ORF Transcript_1534/g.4504 Transcript_1534/m.4504 type:complete len:200 (-) Transcript_1534:633-1232(-)